MSVAAPVRPQRFIALDRANAVRFARAKDKRALCEGRLTVGEVFELDHWQSATVMMVLMALRRVGRGKARQALREAGIGESRTVGMLTRRQREQVLGIVDVRFASRR